jgi:hypothetical protein
VRYLTFSLGSRKRGEIVQVELSTQANVLLLDSSAFSAYKSGRRYRYFGGWQTRSPIELPIPRSGTWHVVVDRGGYGGTVRAGVNVLPGAMKPTRTATTVDDVVENAFSMGDDDDREFDVFISHATEDKDVLVRPLAESLRDRGLAVWFDEFEMRLGDSLRRKIDAGLARSRFGVVVLSPAFLRKNWTQYELDGLVSREMDGEQVILPIWHQLTKDELLRRSPSLVDKVALQSATSTVDEMAAEIADAVLAVRM